jgi:hypothetical protein
MTFAKRHPWIIARGRFVRGEITREQAAAMAASDREFVTEHTLGLHDGTPYECAKGIVDGQWSKEAITYRKTHAAIWDAIKLPDFSNPAVLRGIRKQLADEAQRAPDSESTPILNASNALLRAYVAYLDSVIEGETV